jgi:hypothetical protein
MRRQSLPSMHSTNEAIIAPSMTISQTISIFGSFAANVLMVQPIGFPPVVGSIR